MKNVKVAIVLILDILFVNIALFGAMLFSANTQFNEVNISHYLHIAFVLTSIKILVYKLFSLYESIWEYASIEELMRVVFAVTVSGLIGAGYFILATPYLYFGVFLVAYFVEIVLIGGNRFIYRILRRLKHNKSISYQEDTKRILLVGSGSTASLVAHEIKTHAGRYGRLIGFIDDDKSKKGQLLAGVRILGNRDDIVKVSQRYRVDEIILAIPTASSQDTKQILEKCKLTNAKVTIVPGIVEIIGGRVSMDKIRPVNLEDLLGREVIDLNIKEIDYYIENKVVVVTGGGGSIGSELCRQIINLKPAKLIVIDIYENSIYELQHELEAKKDLKTEVEVLIASVREREAIFDIIKKQKPDVIFHAAAHKHVPLMETSPKEAVKNNIFGTLNIAEAAHKYSVKHFVLISSDKAVNPTSIMGASKRLCEMIVQALARISDTKFVAVRFGNVLGSNGSVIPLFERQIKEGGPVTVTDKDVIRYFMTIKEASQLVIQAGAIAEGGEIFVLDMGEPVKIYNLAIDLIRLSGLKPFEDIDIKFTGLRPGEKLFEELLLEEEGLKRTVFNKIYVGAPQCIDLKELRDNLLILERRLKICSNEEVKELLCKFVPTYKPDMNSYPEKTPSATKA